ncbi:MAG: SUMF1/EgtB/PvdO family nonheme iron enzyme [Sulfitobacter sp.]|nr:SUMF1/EgtB/PvdO family nonheme iron enzyme [Sulfitobacter sp.]
MESDENKNNSIAEGHDQVRLRVFLASPGDVPLVRKLAREAITHLCGERRFRGRIHIEIIAWDQPGAAVAMEAGLTPQEAIARDLPKPEECDLAVIIFWSRIGTRLPSDFELKEDGTPYLSGTEWEYLNALEGYRSNGKPTVWLYRRKGAPNPDLDDPDHDSIVDQWNKLKVFFTTLGNPDSSLAGGINDYEAPDDFRQQFEHHLRDRLDKQLESLPETGAYRPADKPLATPIWTKSPYPGLEALTPEQAPVFFGRGPEVDQLLQQLTSPRVRFIAVVGVSGSGKSSLFKAGLLPRLRTGIIGNTPWVDLIFKPGERGGNPYLALAYVLKSELDIPDRNEQELARAMQADADAARQCLADLLARQQPASDLLLVVDQFEELFTQGAEDDRNDFLALLVHIVGQPRMRVITTQRADFYARAIAEPTLEKLLRRDRGTFPLGPPGLSAIHQMIVRPAEAAGVELEDGLAQRLLDDAGEGPGAMAQIAFTLNQLYLQEKNSGYLSIKGYQAFGGVQGAVQQRAETTLLGLTGVNSDIALPELFAHLVEVNEQEVATRRRALQSRLQGEVKTVADALTEARLLVGGEGEDRQPTLEVAHETVLSGWEKLQQWNCKHAEALRARRNLEHAATLWIKSGRHGSALHTGKLLQRYLDAAEPRSSTADTYLAACKRRRLGLRTRYSLLGLLVITILGILIQVNNSQYPPALTAKATLVQLGIWPLAEPEMVRIPAGPFERGDLSGSRNPDELPVRTVQSVAFAMGRYEVTFDEYDLFAAATGRAKPNDEGWGRGRRPVINVSWVDANAYSRWLSKRTGLTYRLPSEAE